MSDRAAAASPVPRCEELRAESSRAAHESPWWYRASGLVTVSCVFNGHRRIRHGRSNGDAARRRKRMPDRPDDSPAARAWRAKRHWHAVRQAAVKAVLVAWVAPLAQRRTPARSLALPRSPYRERWRQPQVPDQPDSPLPCTIHLLERVPGVAECHRQQTDLMLGFPPRRTQRVATFIPAVCR